MVEAEATGQELKIAPTSPGPSGSLRVLLTSACAGLTTASPKFCGESQQSFDGE